jgi:hypothetical protein
VERRLDVCNVETTGIRFSTVEHVVLGGEDVGRRDAGEIRCEQRRCVRVRSVAGVGEICLAEGVHVDPVEAVTVAEGADRWVAVSAVAEVGNRDFEDLE